MIYIDRLAGATLVAPVINYWWPGFPANASTEAYYLQYPQDQWAVRVAHHTPWLTHWWNTQKWFPASSVIAGRAKFSSQDLEIISQLSGKLQTSKVLLCPSFNPIILELHNLGTKIYLIFEKSVVFQ